MSRQNMGKSHIPSTTLTEAIKYAAKEVEALEDGNNGAAEAHASVRRFHETRLGLTP